MKPVDTKSALAAPAACIELQRMPHEMHLRDAGDNWAGITDQKDRKRLQNRLNKRISRTRQRALKSFRLDSDEVILAPTNSSVNAVGGKPTTSSLSASNSIVESEPSASTSRASSAALDHRHLCPAGPNLDGCPLRDAHVSFSDCSARTIAQKRVALCRFAEHALNSYAKANPCADHGLRLIQLNLISALTQNASSLGFNFDWLVCEVVSPFGRDRQAHATLHSGQRPNFVSSATAVIVPASLTPTSLQLQIRHHPWVDLFPLPALRNNLLVVAQLLSPQDEQELYDDMLGSGKQREWAGLIVWGDPWDLKNWEVSEPFLKKWNWVLSGCQEMLDATNYWRRLRGEKPVAIMRNFAAYAHPLPIEIDGRILK